MEGKEKIIPRFLTGGGEMGELIRSFDWSKTVIGSPDAWPQSLRMAVRIMLDCPFGMYIAWGNQYIQLYNNGYRPILGATKHPQALGISTCKTFAEIWHTIGPMFDGVMQGTPVGFPDFTLQLDRNGYLEECVFDFSYRPIRLEDGEVGGVLVTVIETTEKVNAVKALIESEQKLQFAIEATELGTWDLNPATNKFRGNSRLKEWFGLLPDEEIDLPLALEVIAVNDRDKVISAIETALQFSSGGHYDIIYTIIHPQTKNERIVRAKGWASFNEQGIAYRFNGTLQDVSEEIVARRLLKENEHRLSNERMVLYNSFINAPAGIAILKGDSLIYEFANIAYEKLTGKKITLGKTVGEHFPEIEQQGYIQLIKNVLLTGEPFITNEFPVELNTKGDGILEKLFLNLVLQPLKDEKGNAERVLAHMVDVTEQVITRHKVEASEKRFSNILSQSIMAIAILKGPEMIVEFANEPLIATWRKGKDIIGKPVLEIMPEMVDQPFSQMLQQVYTTGVPYYGYEVQTINVQDGIALELYYNFVYQPYTEADNTITGVTILATEVTEQVLAKKQTAASELFNRTVLESSPDCLKVLDSEGRIQFMNFNGLCQMEVDEFSTIKDKNWWTMWGSENEAMVKAALDKALKGETAHFTALCPTAKGTPKWWDVVVSPVGKPGEPVQQIISVSRDVTEQKKAEEKLKESDQRLNDERIVLYNSFMNAPAGIAILKGDTHIYEFANAEYEKLVDREITIGKTIQELFPEIEQQGLIDILNNVFLTGEPFIANEFPVELMNKRTGKLDLHYYNSAIQPIKDENGNTERLLSHAVEVTHQVEARKQIEVSEQRFGAAVEAVQGILWTNNAKGEMEGEQKGWAALTGQSYEEYQGYGWATAVHPDDAQPTIDAWNEAVKEFKAFVFEHRVKTKSGEWKLFSIKAIPLLNEDGSIREWIGVHTDITERKEAEEKIKESENQFRTFADSIQNLAWIANADGWIYWYNQQWYDYTGTTLEEMEGSGWLKVHHPDHIEKIIELSKDVWKKDKAFELTFPLRRYDGEYRWFLTHAYPVKDANGNVKRWIGTNTDITEQKSFTEELEKQVNERTAEIVEKEDYLNQVISNAPDAVIVINEKNIITLWNPKTEDIFGWKAEEVLGLNLSDIVIPTQYREGHREGMKHLLKTGEARILNKTLELVALNKEGKEFPISLTVSQAVQQGNKLFISFIRDITLEKQNKEDLIVKSKQLTEMNQSLEFKNKQLEITNAELASFSYIASHDLKEPLRKIQVYSKRIIDTENFSEKTQDYFRVIISAGERMQNLIDSLLDFSSVNSTEQIFELCDLNKLVEESKNDLHISISEKEAIIEYENLPVIMGVCIQISQLITNLLDNAIKYSRQGIKPQIKITSSIIEGKIIEHTSANKQTKYHAIKFADNGIGFEQEYENKIFKLFQRLHGKNDYSGTGIGLGIVQKIVTNHKGFIIAEGKPNIGSTFTFYIPTA